MKQETALENFFNFIERYIEDFDEPHLENLRVKYNHCKELERQQIMTAYHDGKRDIDSGFELNNLTYTSLAYYNEMYGKEK